MLDYPYASRFIRRMKHSGTQPVDAGRPNGRCGEQFWFEFDDRATAERFEHDLIVFAQQWRPEP